MPTLTRLPWLLVVILYWVSGCATSREQAGPPQEYRNQALTLATSSGREISMQVFVPADGCTECTLIFFSHGAGLAPSGYLRLLEEWVDQGYVIAAPVHVDSMEHPDRDDYKDFDWVRTRLEDYTQVTTILTGEDSPLQGATLSGSIIAAGHSFGALLAQLAGGAVMEAAVAARLDPRAPEPLAVVALSPPGPIENYISAAGWGQLRRPMLVVTGTADELPGFIPDWQLHLVSYDAAPAGMAYLLVFDDMDHYFNGAFGRPAADGFVGHLALQRLNQLTLQFMQQAKQGSLPTISAWSASSKPGMQARSR